jgi:hypothetical protein
VRATEFAASLRTFVVARLEELASHHLPGWRIPGTFAGHRVEPDVAADLIHTLGHLHAGGVRTVAGSPVTDVLRGLLARIDGRGTHTFFSYRVAETVGLWGRWEQNALLDGLTAPQRNEVARACDSTDWVELLDAGVLPRNYAAVLARCELARRELGLPADPDLLDRLLERVRDVLGANPWHHLDDSNHGAGRFDIYTADVWLFTEPLAPLLGRLWSDGTDTALGLVESVMSDDGTAVAWGRSSGSLAAALTVELAAVAVADGRGDDPGRWLARGRRAAAALPGWFTDGVVDAHRYRSPYGYRGPFRRLQLTLDLLGKLAWAANRLERAEPSAVAADDRVLDGPRDELIRFHPRDAASVWSHRGPGGGVVVPFVGASRSDYLAAPRAPGRFEVPVDADLACWVPMAVAGTRRLTTSGVPAGVEHLAPGAVRARWDGLTADAELDPEPAEPILAGTVEVTYSVAGRGVRADWHLDLERAPTALAFLVPERTDRPLAVTWQPGTGTTGVADSVLTAGIAEWRSYWSELGTVHQFDLDPAPRVRLRFTVTPKLRVASTAHGHHYHRCLYAPLADRVWDRPSPWGPLGDRTVDPDQVDLFHLHWPEWLAFDDEAAHVAIIEDLARRDIPVLWTAHNLTPHEKRPGAFDPIYRRWLDAAAVVVHHSRVGRERFLDRYGPGDGTRHVVIPHGHFGDLWVPHRLPRHRAEIRLGLPPARLRIGLVGAPRQEKHVAAFLEGVARCQRDDVQVVCWSLRGDEEVPDDDRIAVAEPYAMAEPAVYAARLSACDALALPFDPDGEMLATGTVFDAVGLGLPALCSSWDFLTEVLGEAAVPVGHRPEEVAEALDRLDDDTLARARQATLARREALRWDDVAARLEAVADDLVTGTRRT